MLQEQEADRVHALMHMCVHVAVCAHTQQQETILEYANEGVFFFLSVWDVGRKCQREGQPKDEK